MPTYFAVARRENRREPRKPWTGRERSPDPAPRIVGSANPEPRVPSPGLFGVK